jgi:hypothetical protein
MFVQKNVGILKLCLFWTALLGLEKGFFSSQ